MNTEVKEKWVKALRSGEYKQGRGTLKFNDEFCCLGVLEDLYCKEVGEEFPVEHRTLTNACRAWAGLDRYDPLIQFSHTAATLSYINDVMHRSFDEIADIIEEHL